MAISTLITAHKYLGLIGSVGFSTVLTGRASLMKCCSNRVPRINCPHRRRSPTEPSELLGSQAAEKVLDELRAGFD